MKVLCFAGYSGSGKTQLIESLIPALRQRGARVSVIKHAHHGFDIDQPGKDSHRHRQAGATEVLLASDQRLALMREFERPGALSVHQLLAELGQEVDWVLVEGFKDVDLPKLEIWREAIGRPVHYPDDPFVVAVVTADALPEPTLRPVLELNRPDAVVDWLVDNQHRFDYRPEIFA